MRYGVAIVESSTANVVVVVAALLVAWAKWLGPAYDSEKRQWYDDRVWVTVETAAIQRESATLRFVAVVAWRRPTPTILPDIVATDPWLVRTFDTRRVD